MDSDRLIINDKDVDLLAGTIIALTYQINNLAELKDRQANFSNQFKVPRSEYNIELFGWSNLIQSTSAKPYRKLPAKVIKKGIEVIPVGYAIIESAGDVFNVTVYSGIIDFFEFIDARNLRQLDLSAYDHLPTISGVISANPNVSGYKYPLIDYGQLSNLNRNVQIQDLRVAFFIHTIIDQIFTESPYKKGGDFFNDANYKKLLLVQNDEPFWLANITLNITYGSSLAPAPHTIKVIREDSLGNLTTIAQSQLLVPSTFFFGHFTLSQIGVRLLPTDKIYVESTGNGGIGTQGISRGNVTYPIYGYQPYSSLNIEYPNDPSKNISIGLSADQTLITSGTERVQFDDEVTPFFDTPASYNTTLFENVTPPLGSSQYLVDMKQKDLMLTIANQFALFFASDIYTKTMYAARMNDIVNNIPFAINWGDKLHDDRKTWSLVFRIGKYGQKNYLKYKKDGNDKDITDGLGNGYFTIGDDNLPVENTQIELPFAASMMERSLIDLDVPIIRRIEGGEFKTKTEPRMVVDDTQNFGPGATAIHYDDGVTTSDETSNIPLCYFQLFEKSFNLGFDNSLLNDYWDGVINMLQFLKDFTAPFYLTPNDAARLNTIDPNTKLPYWFTPIYIPQLSSNFYINKIQNFTGNGLTKVELIRLGGGNVCIPLFGPELLTNTDFAAGDDGNYFQDQPADWTIDNTGAQHAGGTNIGSILREFTPTESPTVKWRAEIRVTGHTTGTYQAQWGSGGGGIVRGVGAAPVEIMAGVMGVQSQFLVATSADFDGKIIYESLKAQLTCP